MHAKRTKQDVKRRLTLQESAAIVLSMVLVAAFLLWLFIGRPLSFASDLDGAQQQQAEAKVLAVTYEPATEGATHPRFLLRLSLSGVEVEAAITGAPLKVGQAVRATYRVGRSGRVYVERVEPLPPPRP